jgi:hypothetical protein
MLNGKITMQGCGWMSRVRFLFLEFHVPELVKNTVLKNVSSLKRGNFKLG